MMSDECGTETGSSRQQVFAPHSSLITPRCLLGYIVDAPRMPRVALADAFDGQPGAFQRAVGCDGLPRIGRAGRIEPALRAEKRRQQQPVAVDQENQQGYRLLL